MEYQVPQFIEVEEKIFGPLSLKQFVYIAGGLGLCVVLVLYISPRILGIIIALPVAALTFALAFYKVNNKPFIEIMEAGFNYYLGGRLYLWKREDKPVERAAPAPVSPAEETRAKIGGLSQSKLKDLAWSLDIKDANQ